MTIQEIHSKFDQMLSEHNGQLWEVEDPTNRDQCFDLALGWCDYLGIPREAIRHLNASQIWTQPLDVTLQHFDYIPNTPSGTPQKGDIVVFGGVVGHVSVANGEGDNNTFTSFDQNFPLGSSCHLQNHDYKNVLGWLRPNSAIIAQPIAQGTLSDGMYFTDQTHIPAILLNNVDFPVTQDTEIQAVRGWLGDYGRYMKSHPDTPQKSPEPLIPSPVMEYPPFLIKFLKWLSDKFK